MNDQDLHNLCNRWVAWRRSKRIYVKPTAANVLARFQPSSSGPEPDAGLDPAMHWFNAGVGAVKAMDEHAADFDCFWLFYVVGAKNIKRVAADLGIGRRTFYERAHRAARLAYRISIGIQDVAMLIEQGVEVVD